MERIVSRQFFALVISSYSCLTRHSKSEESVPEVGWVGGPRGWSASRDLVVVLEALFRVIVIEGLDFWALLRAQVSSKAAEQGGSTVKGTGSEEGEGSLICRHNWISSSSSRWIVVHSLWRSLFLVLRSTMNWATCRWTAWRYWNCLVLANGKVWIMGFVCSRACSEVILRWSTWVVNKRSCSETVGLLESEEVLGHLTGTVRSATSISISNSGRYIANSCEQFFRDKYRCMGIQCHPMGCTSIADRGTTSLCDDKTVFWKLYSCLL